MFAAGPRPKPVIRAAINPAIVFNTSDSTDGDEHRHDHLARVARVDRQAEREEEHRRERVAQRQHQPLDPVCDRCLGQHEPDHERADRVGHAELLGNAGGEHGKADEADRQQLVVGRIDQPADDPGAASGRPRPSASRNASAVANWPTASSGPSAFPSTGCSTAR